jgi:rod shape-determining protein MreC
MDYRRPGLIARLAVSLRGTGQRFVFVSLVVAGLAFMVLGKSDAALVERMRTMVADVATPILETVLHPVEAVDRGIVNVKELVALRKENAQLRQEIERLRAWHGAAHRLALQNQAFKAMVNYKGPERFSFVTGRVVGDGRGPFVRSVLLNIGTRDGAAKGQAVLANGGLVGRVTSAGNRSARVLLLTDLNSRIPVLIENTRTRAILVGDNSARPLLRFLPEIAFLKPGQRIVTSGHAGVLPAGLPVAKVVSVKPGEVRVQPLVDLERIEYMQIVRFRPLPAPKPAMPDKAQGVPAN